MMAQPFTTAQLPTYHEGMLIVKVRSAVLSTAMMAVDFADKGGAVSPGLSALARLERAGLIKYVLPLAREKGEERPPPPRAAMRSITASIERTVGRASFGVSVIAFERDQDARDLQLVLADDPLVEFAARIPVRYLTARRVGASAVPPGASTMWNLKRILWSEARSLGGFREAADIRVAVLDTGVDGGHPDLAGRVSRYIHSYPEVPTPSGERDIVGHGTHVSGTIGAIINNDIGINGICAAQLYVWKIFSDEARCFDMTRGFAYYVDPVMYRRALADCLDARVNIVNLSIGGPGAPDQQEQQLFDALLAQGTVVIAAMGNDRMAGSPTSYPAAILGVIAVGATNIDDSLANFSNRGDHISLCAPGKAIWSTLPTYPGQFGFEAIRGPDGRLIEGKPLRRETHYDAWDGTSMASPHVAGAAALLLAKRRKLSPADVREALMSSADRVPEMGGNEFDSDHGAGRLNLLHLLQ